MSDLRPLLTVEDVARILRISRSMAYRIMADGRLRTVAIGRSVRVRPADLERYIDVNEP